MGVITPKLTLTSNASTASTDAGPLSIALSLSATDSLTVTGVRSKIETITDTAEVLWAHGDFSDGTETAGTDGGFVYVKNIHASNKISIGHGALEEIVPNNNAKRVMTLLAGDFAWFPWDLETDIIQDSNASTENTLETWIFVRTGTA